MLWHLGKPVNGRLFEHIALSRSLSPFSIDLPKPELPGIEDAVRVTLSHLNEQIAVFGDYDCDGICSALILSRALEQLGAEVFVRLPTRKEGFGLKTFHVQELAAKGVRLIITVDNGTQALEAVEAARSLGVSIIITDHHERGPVMPDCPVVNPKLGGSYRWYAGAGVAWLFATALFAAKNLPAPVELLDLVSLATVVDVVPITGPNWALARKGLEIMRDNPSPGIKALASSAGVSQINGRSMGWQLGPRLNSSGRIADPMTAYRLLAAEGLSQAEALAGELSRLNRSRQELVSMVVKDCLAKYQNNTFFPVFAGDYPRGVVGIVAGKLAETFRLPVLVGTCEQGIVYASGRTIGSFDILSALTETKTPLQFGGHSAACGASFELRDLSLLQNELSAIAQKHLKPESVLDAVDIDGIIKHIPTPEEVEELDLLEPFGEENPEPVFALYGKAISLCSKKSWQLINLQGIKMFAPVDTLQGEEALYVAANLYLDEWKGNFSVMANPLDIRKNACTRRGLRKAFRLWRSGLSIPGYIEKIFREIDIPRSGAVTPKNLYHSRTFLEVGIEDKE